MRIFFIGARIVGYNTLQALLQKGFNIVGALFLDDKRRDITVAHKNFDSLIVEYRLNAKTYTSLGKPEYMAWMQDLDIDIGLVIGVSNLIPSKMLEIPKLGFIGMHPTLLPVGRGRAPIPWTLIKDLKKSGTTLFICDAEADTGKILAQKSYPVHYEDTCTTLGKRSDDAVIELLINSLPEYYNGNIVPFAQDEGKATRWEKRTPADGLVDWKKSSREIYNWIRALTNPYPGAFTFFHGKKVMIWAARESADLRTGLPGNILDVTPSGILVSTGSGNLILTKIGNLEMTNEIRGQLFQN
jgi:methionyl-tRNA formyltransferase